MVLMPRESGKYISSNSNHVKINSDAVTELGNMLLKTISQGKLLTSTFSESHLHPKPSDSWTIDWIFVIDTLNFCFWTVENECKWTVDNQTGYFALCAAINKAKKNGVEILNPQYYSKVTKAELSNLLMGDDGITNIPLIDERLKCLHEVGNILLEKFNGTFKTCVELAQRSALSLLKIITDNFPCFCDEAIFHNKKVAFYKRAQILVADIWSCYDGNRQSINDNFAQFNDIGEITMFADYRVPQCLNYFKVLNYSDKLLNILNSHQLLESGSELEVEIRGCSIHAIDLLTEYINSQLSNGYKINSVLVDQYLWEHRREINNLLALPFHRTISIYY